MATEHICTSWGFLPVHQKQKKSPSPMQHCKFSAPNLLCHEEDKLLHHKPHPPVKAWDAGYPQRISGDNQGSLNT